MKTLCTALLLLVAAPLCAQTTLDDYRAAVAGYSRQLKVAAAQVDAAAQTLGQARTGRLPRLAADGSFSLSARHHDGVERWTFSLLPQIVQTLYGGGAVRASVHSAEAGYDIALCDEEFSQLEVRYAADYAYWSLSAAELYAEAMRQYVAIIRSLKQVVDRRFAEGLIARGDVLMIDARLSEAEFELVSGEQRREVAQHNFNVLRGEEATRGVRLAQGIRDSMPMPRRVEAAQLPSDRADYAAAQLRTEQAQAAVEAARASYNPQLSVGVGGSWQPDTPNRTGRTSLDGAAFVKLSVPIFHWGEGRKKVRKARYELRNAQLDLQKNTRLMSLEVEQAIRNVEDGYRMIQPAELALRQAEENLRVMCNRHAAQMAPLTDLLDAQSQWQQAASNRIEAATQYQIYRTEYLRATGRLE